jgi:hypothetical protein
MYGPANYAATASMGTSNVLTDGQNKPQQRNAEAMGLIPRAIDEIFELVNKRNITDFQVHCSFVQIYNENLFDMLRSANTHV